MDSYFWKHRPRQRELSYAQATLLANWKIRGGIRNARKIRGDRSEGQICRFFRDTIARWKSRRVGTDEFPRLHRGRATGTRNLYASRWGHGQTRLKSAGALHLPRWNRKKPRATRGEKQRIPRPWTPGENRRRCRYNFQQEVSNLEKIWNFTARSSRWYYLGEGERERWRHRRGEIHCWLQRTENSARPCHEWFTGITYATLIPFRIRSIPERHPTKTRFTAHLCSLICVLTVLLIVSKYGYSFILWKSYETGDVST